MKPVAWCVTCDGETDIYGTRAEAMFWGAFKADYSATPVLVSPLYKGRSKKFAPRGTRRRGPVNVWIPKVMW